MLDNLTNRREFLQTAAAGVAAASLSQATAQAMPLEVNDAGIPVRSLGKTGEKVTILGLGGFHSTTKPEAESLRIIRRAVRLYGRFTLSYRDVEDPLAGRGLDVSYETVRRWVLKFGPPFALMTL